MSHIFAYVCLVSLIFSYCQSSEQPFSLLLPILHYASREAKFRIGHPSCEFLDYSRVRPLRSFIHHMTSTDLKLDVMSLFHLLYILTLLIRKVEYRQVKSRKIVSQNCYALGLLQLLAESTFFLSISWCWFMGGRHYFQSTFQSIRHLRARCFISASIITFINNFFQCRVLRKYLRVQKGNLPLKTIYNITQ